LNNLIIEEEEGTEDAFDIESLKDLLKQKPEKSV
jgi:hypothetical protein